MRRVDNGPKELPAPRALIALAGAAAVVHGSVTGDFTANTEALNRIARLIASRTKMFTCETGDAAS